MSDVPEGNGEGLEFSKLSRRRMLKRIGAGAAVAWSAPVLSSLRTPAFAQYPPPHEECRGATCAAFIPCSGPNPDCVCVTTSEGTGTCTPGSTLCSTLAICGPGGACAPGTFCAVDTCCVDPVCIPIDLSAQCPTASGAGTEARASTGAGTVGG
jgi:hypothetical protein